MQDLQESLLVVAKTRVCIVRMQALARANRDHVAQARQAIRESVIALSDAKRVI